MIPATLIINARGEVDQAEGEFPRCLAALREKALGKKISEIFAPADAIGKRSLTSGVKELFNGGRTSAAGSLKMPSPSLAGKTVVD